MPTIHVLHRSYQYESQTRHVLMGVFDSSDKALAACQVFAAKVEQLGLRQDQVGTSPQTTSLELSQCDTFPAHVFVCARVPKQRLFTKIHSCEPVYISATWQEAQEFAKKPVAPRSDKVCDEKISVFLMPLNTFRWKCHAIVGDLMPSVIQDDLQHVRHWISSQLKHLDYDASRQRAQQTGLRTHKKQQTGPGFYWPQVLKVCNVRHLCMAQGIMHELQRAGSPTVESFRDVLRKAFHVGSDDNETEITLDRFFTPFASCSV